MVQLEDFEKGKMYILYGVIQIITRILEALLRKKAKNAYVKL